MHITSVHFTDIATQRDIGDPYECSAEMQPTQFHTGDILTLNLGRGDELTRFSVVAREVQQADDLGAFGLIYRLRRVPEKTS